MIKKIFGFMLIILSLAIGVSAVGDITLSPNTGSFTANVSETITGSFTIQNTNTTNSLSVSLPSTIDFLGTTTNQTGVGISYNVTSPLAVANLTTESINYTITVPANAKNEAFTGILNMTANTQDYDTLTLTLNVNAAPAMTIENAALNVAESNSKDVKFNMTNTGNSDLSVTLTATDLIGSSMNISSTNVGIVPANPVTLEHGTSKEITVTITAPANSSSSTAYSGKIVADYNSGNQINNTLSVTVQTVSESIQITESIADATIVRSSSLDASTKFKIKNSGNVDLGTVSFTLSDLVMDANNSISNSLISASSISLDAGNEKEVTISITPQPSFAVGTYNGNLTVNYGTGKTHVETYKAVVRDNQALFGLPSQVVLGSEDQKRGENLTTSFNISNAGVAGDSSLTGIILSSTASSKYKIEFSKDNSIFFSTLDVGSLLIGGTQPIYVRGFIPLDENAGSVTIGKIDIKSNQANATISSFLIKPRLMLEIEDVDVTVDGDEDTNLGNGDTIKYEAEPGKTVEIDIKFNNKFTSSEDIEINDIDVKVTIKGIDNEDDIELEPSEFDLSAGRTKTLSLDFEVPYKVDSATYSIVIEVESKDDNRAEHNLRWELRLPVEKQPHKLLITDASFGQPSLECIRSTTFSVKVLNVGDRKEDEGVIKVTGSALGLNERVEFEFDNRIDNDEVEFSKTYSIDASNMKPGKYDVVVQTYYAGDDLSDKSTATLTINACDLDDEISINDNKADKDSEAIILEQNIDDLMNKGGAVADEITVKSNKGSFKESSGYVFLLVLGNIVIIAVAIFLIFKFLMAPPKNDEFIE